jgi:hypothetical protein
VLEETKKKDAPCLSRCSEQRAALIRGFGVSCTSGAMRSSRSSDVIKGSSSKNGGGCREKQKTRDQAVTHKEKQKKKKFKKKKEKENKKLPPPVYIANDRTLSFYCIISVGTHLNFDSKLNQINQILSLELTKILFGCAHNDRQYRHSSKAIILATVPT